MNSTNDEEKALKDNIKIAEKFTYERIKRVINGYSDGKEKPKPLNANLKYLDIKLTPKAKCDGEKLIFARKFIETICFKNNTFNEISKNNNYVLFDGADTSTAIIFDEIHIIDVKKEILKLNKKCKVYILSFCISNFDEEFNDISQVVEVVSFPESAIKSCEELTQRWRE